MVTADANCGSLAGRCRFCGYYLKYESYVFVDETSQRLLALVEQVGASEVTVLFRSATGSGEVLARLAHDFPYGGDGRCAGGARAAREPRRKPIVRSCRGCLYRCNNTEGFASSGRDPMASDEVGELSPQLQAKLLRAIKKKKCCLWALLNLTRWMCVLFLLPSRDLRFWCVRQSF